MWMLSKKEQRGRDGGGGWEGAQRAVGISSLYYTLSQSQRQKCAHRGNCVWERFNLPQKGVSSIQCCLCLAVCVCVLDKCLRRSWSCLHRDQQCHISKQVTPVVGCIYTSLHMSGVCSAPLVTHRLHRLQALFVQEDWSTHDSQHRVVISCYHTCCWWKITGNPDAQPLQDFLQISD